MAEVYKTKKFIQAKADNSSMTDADPKFSTPTQKKLCPEKKLSNGVPTCQ